MPETTGINGFRRTAIAQRLNYNFHNHALNMLKAIASPSAQSELDKYQQLRNGPARLTTLYNLICNNLRFSPSHLNKDLFVANFQKHQIENLDLPRSPDDGIRFLLERVFQCSLAYHAKTNNLSIISTNEKRSAEYQSRCPFGRENQTIIPSTLTETSQLESTVKSMARWSPAVIAGRRMTYSTELARKILFHFERGHLRNAAILLFREQRARDIIKFLKEDHLAITDPELGRFLTHFSGSARSDEIAAAALLSYLPISLAAHFIADLTTYSTKKAVRILGCLGKSGYSASILNYGDQTLFDQQGSIASIIYSLLLQNKVVLANNLVRRGTKNRSFRVYYLKALNELHENFNEDVLNADDYLAGKRKSLLRKGTSIYSSENGKDNRAMVRVGEAFLAPRYALRKLIAELCLVGDYEGAWDIATCGKRESEAFYDLNCALPPLTLGKLFRTRSRNEIIDFITEVVVARQDYYEPIAHALLYLYEDLRDTAAFFEHMIETSVIPLSRQAAYGVLYYGVTALGKVGTELLSDRYIEILVQIEQDKKSMGWHDANTFIREGRFMPCDSPSQLRADRLDNYFHVFINESYSKSDRLFALQKIARVGAVEYLEGIRPIIDKGLREKKYDEFLMSVVVAYLDLCEDLDLGNPENQLLYRSAKRYLKEVRDHLVTLFHADVEAANRALIKQDQRPQSIGERGLIMADLGREEELNSIILSAKESRHDGIKAATAVSLAKIGNYKTAAALTEEIGDEFTRSRAFEEIIDVMLADKLVLDAEVLFNREPCLRPDYIQARILSKIARAKLLDGDIEGALLLARQITNNQSGHRTLTLKDVALAMHQDQLPQARISEVFEEAISAAEAMTKDLWGNQEFFERQKRMKASALGEVALAMDKAGLPKHETLNILTNALSLCKKISKQSFEYYSALEAIAISMIKCGFYDEALLICSDYDSYRTLIRIAREMINFHSPKENIMGFIEEALVRIDEDKENFLDRENYTGEVFDIMLRAGYVEEALTIIQRADYQWFYQTKAKVIKTLFEQGDREKAIILANSWLNHYYLKRTFSFFSQTGHCREILEKVIQEKISSACKIDDNRQKARHLYAIADLMTSMVFFTGQEIIVVLEEAYQASQSSNDESLHNEYGLAEMSYLMSKIGCFDWGINAAREIIERRNSEASLIWDKVYSYVEDILAETPMDLANSDLPIAEKAIKLEELLSLVQMYRDLNHRTKFLCGIVKAISQSALPQQDVLSLFEKIKEIAKHDLDEYEGTVSNYLALRNLSIMLSQCGYFKEAVSLTEMVEVKYLIKYEYDFRKKRIRPSSEDSLRYKEIYGFLILKDIFLEMLKAGLPKQEVIDTLKKVLSLIKGVEEDHFHQSRSLFEITEALIKSSHYEEAMDLVREIKPGATAFSMRQICSSLITAGYISFPRSQKIEDLSAELISTLYNNFPDQDKSIALLHKRLFTVFGMEEEYQRRSVFQ